MARFDPQPGDRVSLGSTTYEVMPHPAVQYMAFGQEGRKAVVYQLKGYGRFFALKVFKSVYRDPHLVDTCQVLSKLTLPGLEVCDRQCLTPHAAKSLVKRYPEMEYAILMPWIEGATWFDIVMGEIEISEGQSRQLAQSTVDVLTKLEARGYAHCDIAGGNVIVNTGTGHVGIIDVEDMFGPGLPPPGSFPQGTAGYQHQSGRVAKRGQWCAEGDRFSAAVLLAEVLTWHDSRIRREADNEHYFAEGELQDPDSRRYKLIAGTLANMSRQVADCFEAAWRARTLAEAPALDEWAKALETISVPLEKAPPKYQCLSCKTQFDEPVAGNRCPRCGGRHVKPTAVERPPSPRPTAGFRCSACHHQFAHLAFGGRCPNCGARRVTQAVMRTVARPAPAVRKYECLQCRHRFTQPAPGWRCPRCAAKIFFQ